MKANELRIGNYVNVRVPNQKELKSVKVESLNSDINENNNITLDIGHRISGDDAISGIPLTEEWLLKFGFAKKIISGRNDDFGDDILYELEERNFFLCYESSDFSIAIAYDRKGYDRGSCICPLTKLFRNVHQLQNLYFSLKGEELTIKPNQNDTKI